MTVRIINSNASIRERQPKANLNKMRELERYLWSGIKGLWKDKKIDAVAYQRKLRRESDSAL